MTAAWRELPPGEAATWTTRVYSAGAPLWQLPFWTAFLDRSGLRTAARTLPVRRFRYFVQPGRAWACVMEVAAAGYKAALVQDGPVGLTGPVDAATIGRLCAMLRARGYVFVRFSNRPDRLATVSSQHRAVPVDLLPCLQRAGWELHVPLVSDEDRMLAAFSQRARRAIRRAESEGWEIVRATADDGFDQVYGLLAETAARKGFRAPPPRETFAALVADAAPVDGVRMYLACRPDGGPASAVVAVVDGTTWHYLWGGVDAEHLRGGVSPTALLHWTAMRDAIRRGADAYNLGARSPSSVEHFKRQFRPLDVEPPPAVTVPLRLLPATAWRRVALPASRVLWRPVRKVWHRLAAATEHVG